MSFSHGKQARLFIDQYDLTNYFNEFQMAAKAGVADTTVFGKGARTFIGGLKEGQITSKGFYDASANAVDPVLAAALGRSTNMAVTFDPDGLTANLVVGSRCIVAYAAEVDYNITSPVTGVNAVSFSAQADSGLSSGVWLYDPTFAALAVVGATTGTASTTVAAGSNAVASNSFTGAGTLNVAATTNFQTAGTLIVATSTTPAYISYTGTTGTTFTGCNTIIAGGNFATGGSVAVGAQDSLVATTGGFVANLHVLTFSGTVGPTITAKVQHSSDGSTWVDLTSFNGGNTITAVGAFSAFVAYGTTINKYLRAVIVTGGTTISTTLGISAARQ